MDGAMKVTSARRAALLATGRVRERAAYGPETLDHVLAEARLTERDAAFARRLTYGVLQTSGTLDEAIDEAADRPSRIEPAIRDALRIATYELLFMRTPARAAVNEGVEAARAARPQAAGMANAVLRRIAERATTFPWGDPATDDRALARATGHPIWIVERWVAELGRERASSALYADLEPAPLYLWVNPFRASFEEALDVLERDGAEPAPDLPAGCIRVGEAAAALSGAALEQGMVLVTDAAAQIAARACGARPGGIVVDVASGRGTKTVELQALSAAAGSPAEIYALDLHGFKARVLEDRMASLGVPGVRALSGDATHLPNVAGMPGPGTVDAVLLDAPCSGLGALRRRPEKRWRITPEDIERLSVLQSDLLERSATLVRPGGTVVYSTCAVGRHENQDVVHGFLRDAGGAFETAGLRGAVPEEWHDWIGPEGWFQSVPSEGGPDGHFVAALRRVR